jgi:membrane protease YdiL (CAAX protease family)
MASTLFQPPSKAGSILDYEKAKETLRSEFVKHSLGSLGLANSSLLTGDSVEFDEDLAKKRFADPEVAAFYAAFLTEEGKRPTVKDLAALQGSQNPFYRRIGQVYESPRLTRSDADGLTRNLNVDPFLARAVRAQAFKRVGDPSLEQDISHDWLLRFGAAATIGSLVLCGSFAAWMYFIVKKAGGGLRPLGFATDLRTLLDADRLAMLAALLLALFLVAQVVIEGVVRHVPERDAISQIVLGVAMLFGVPLVLAMPVMGRRIRLSGTGFLPSGLLGLIWAGFVAFLMEWPVAVGLAAVGEALFSRFHQASHPVTIELLSSPSLLTIFAAFFLGAVVAPFWEEIMFRGLMFPAISRIARSPAWGAAISSFIFGALHPQGLPLWMTLMTIGAASCALSYHTRSLVPSMTLHFCHNAFTLALSLLVS